MNLQVIKSCLLALAMYLPVGLSAQDKPVSDSDYQQSLRAFQAGQNDTSFLRKLAESTLEKKDSINGERIIERFISVISRSLDSAQLALIDRFNSNVNTAAFQFFQKNAGEIDRVKKAPYAVTRMSQIIFFRLFLGKPVTNTPAGWRQLKTLAKPYGAAGRDAYLHFRAEYFKANQLWDDFAPAFDTYCVLERYHNLFELLELNNNAWAVFEHTKKLRSLQLALRWAKHAAANADEGTRDAPLDTQACLLYRLGKKDEAISLVKQAIAIANQYKYPTKEFEDHLNGMLTGTL